MLKIYQKLLNYYGNSMISRKITNYKKNTIGLHGTEKKKRYFANNYQEDLIYDALRNGRIRSTNDWISIKREVLAKGRTINDVNFDATAIGFCITDKNYDAAKLYIKLLNEENKKLNVAALGKFMRLYYTCNKDTDKINITQENLILSMYNDLKKEYPVFASTTGEHVIHAISITKQWRDCVQLLEDMKISGQPSASTYSVVIKAAFENQEYDLGWKLMEEMISLQRLPLPAVYTTWLKNEQNNPKNIKKLLQFLANSDIHPSTEVTDTFLDIMPKYTGVYTTITNSGVCKHCKAPLEKINFNLDEFEHLKSVFMNNVILGKNTFNTTTPKELDCFKQFVDRVGKVDVVVDGLNVAYSSGVKSSANVYGKLLANVIKHYRQQSKRVMVLGRVHMDKWPSQYMNYIRANSEMFLAQNLSQDDLFLLYATMASGLGTHFLSRDYMRGHTYQLMDVNLKRIFRRWQQSHQNFLIFVEDNGKVHLKTPFSTLPTIQEHQHGWHIPYIREHLPIPPVLLEPPKNWLCIRKK